MIWYTLCKRSIRTMPHDQIIQAQAQYLQRLTAKQDALTNAMQALSDANVRLNESMLAQERESETRKARLEVLEKSPNWKRERLPQWWITTRNGSHR